jgi:Na+/H+ antiporter NhaD/arsenite permease-like protein
MISWRDPTTLAAVLIFTATYAVVAFGKAPGLRLDRAGAALFGAGLMIACGVLSLEDAYRAIDLDTITLLLGMMIVVANLRLSGIFRLVAGWMAARAHHPLLLLTAIAVVTGVLSAFLVNDTICLVMTPIVVAATRALDRNPAPYLLAVAMASNVGSVATITGNPQNMLIGAVSGLPYATFAAALAPVAGFGLIATIALVALAYRREFFTRERLGTAIVAPARVHRHLAAKSIIVTLAMVALFFAGQPVAKVALIGGGLLLFTRIVKPAKVYREIDGPLLVMFAGLFVVVAGLEKSVLTPDVVAQARAWRIGEPWLLGLVTAGLSNLVSNVPAVLVLKPFVAQVADPQRAWLVVAMASTLAGNLTLIGSVANLIVAERARRDGVIVGFWDYAKVGVPLTALTLAFGIWWLH